MAEELNLEEGTESMSMPDLSAFDTSSLTSSIDTKNIDAYSNVVGNPITGSNPQSKLQSFDTSTIADNFENKIRQSAATYDNPYKKMRPYSYNGDYDGANFERYHSTDQYKTLGFSPYRDNESLYNNNMTLGDQFTRAASQWDNLVGTGFKSGIKSWGTLFTDPLAPDMESADEMKRAMAIGSSGAGGLGGFAVNTFLNSGFSIGIAADFVAEELALAAATAFTGGLAGEATVPGMFAKAGLAARRLAGFGEAAAQTMKTINKGAEIERLAKAGKQGNETLNTLRNGLNSVPEMQSFWNTAGGKFAKGAFDIVNPFENTIKALGKTDYATGLAKTAKTFGGFVDDVIQIKGTVSEAVLEGGMTKLDVTEKLIDQYRAANFGQDPEGEELTKIENLASQEAHRVALYNLPAISVSNKLMYATMIAPISKLIGRGSSTSLNSILFKKALKGVDKEAPFEVLGQGMGARASAALKSLASPKTYGKFGMDYLKANIAEGVQENIQDAISSAAVEHSLATYSDPSKAAYEGYMSYFMEGLGSQFSAQGAETFAGGLAMGMFAQPVMGSATWTISELSDIVNKKQTAAYKANKEAQDQRDVAALNALYKDDLKFFAPDLKNSIKQQGLAKDFKTAIENGDEKEARDAQFNALQSHLSTAIRTGKLDIFLDKLGKYKELDPKSALEAFQKYGITTEEDAVKAQGQINGVIERAEKLRNKSENIGSEFPNPYSYQQYQAGTPLHSATVKAYEAWEEAKQNLLYAESAFEDHADRVSKMAATFSSIANEIGQTDAQTLMRLLDPNDTVTELATLQKELESLDPALPEQKKLIKDKEKTFELLSYYHNLVKISQLAKTPEQKKELDKEAKKAFKAYINHVSKKNNTIVFDKQVNKAYQLILDSHSLKNEMKGLARSINVLSNPEGFLNTQERIYTAFQELDKEKIVSDNNKTFGKVILNNKLHNGIFKKTGLKIPEDFMDAYKKAAEAGEELPTPTAFVNPKTNELVTEGEDFDNALEIWNGFVEVVPKEESKTKKKEPVINTEGEKEYKNFSDNLKDDITALFEQAKKDGEIDKDETIGNFIKTNEKAILQIKVTQTQEKLEKLQAEQAEEPEKVASAKIETAPHPETVDQLNLMGYSNTQIKELTRDERNKILTEGIAPEDFYKNKPAEPITTPTDLETLKQTPEGKEIEARRSKALENHKVAVPITEKSFTENQPEYVLTAEDKVLLGKYNIDLDPSSDNIENLTIVDSIEKGNDLINTKYNAELEALKVKPTETVKDNTSETKDAINNTPIQPSKASGNKVLYTPRKIVELAYANDEDNNPKSGGYVQELSNIIRRGGYAIEELDVHLPGWRTMSLEAEPTKTQVKVAQYGEYEVYKNPNGTYEVLDTVEDGVIESSIKTEKEARTIAEEASKEYRPQKIEDISNFSDLDTVEEYKNSLVKDVIKNYPVGTLFSTRSEGRDKSGEGFITYNTDKFIKISETELKSLDDNKIYSLKDPTSFTGKRDIQIKDSSDPKVVDFFMGKSTTTVKKAPTTPINDEYIGKIIYMTPGSDKEELAKNNSNVVDVDDLILQTAQDLKPIFKPDLSIEKYKQIGRAYDAVGKKELQDQVVKNMKELANKGMTLITSSLGLMKNADIIMIQGESKFITKGYDTFSEIQELANIDKTTIAILDTASNVLKNPISVLMGQSVAQVAEEIEPQDITEEYINKNINEKNLNIAKDKGFDAVYKNERYAIVKVNKKTVSLKPIEGNPISVNIADITAVASSEKVPVSEEEIDIFNQNQSNVKKSDITLDETSTDVKDTLNDIINNLCNKK